MRHLLACLAILAAFNVTAQVDGFQLPYNPDSEPDGYIGVGDVLEVLSIFGSQWNASDIYLSNDSTSMTMFVGEMIHPLCLAACDDLPGSWQMSSLTDLGRIWDEMPSSNVVWYNRIDDGVGSNMPAVNFYNGFSYTDTAPSSNGYCYCSTQERPKVEYTMCHEGSKSALLNCTSLLTAQGWLPLGPVSYDGNAGYQFAQALWRWVD